MNEWQRRKNNTLEKKERIKSLNSDKKKGFASATFLGYE